MITHDEITFHRMRYVLTLQEGLHMISALKAIGCPDVIFCIEGSSYSSNHHGSALDHDTMQLETASVANSVSVTSSMHRRKVSVSSIKTAVHDHIFRTAVIPEARVVDINTPDKDPIAGNQLARTLRNLTPRPVSWLSSRSYFVADTKHVVCTEQTNYSGVVDQDGIQVDGDVAEATRSKTTCTMQGLNHLALIIISDYLLSFLCIHSLCG